MKTELMLAFIGLILLTGCIDSGKTKEAINDAGTAYVGAVDSGIEKVGSWWNDDDSPSYDCCWPTECPQAVDNPDTCTCTWIVACVEG